jgi:hypothetical protein
MPRHLLPIVERAVVFADAALDEPTDECLNLARATIHRALERIEASDVTAREARTIAALASRLRALLYVVERRASRLPGPLLS